jgi:DNA repair protein RadC
MTHRLFDSAQLAVLDNARQVLSMGARTLKGRTPLYPTDRKAQTRQEAKEGREALTMFLQLRIGALPHERSLLTLFDAQGRLIEIVDLPEGDLTSCPVSYRLVAGHVTHLGAAMCLLSHNHPSGDCSPSKADIVLFSQMRDWLKAMGCLMIDSLVFTVDEWSSISGDWTC